MAALLQIISGFCTLAQAQGQPITFSAFGDIPYGSSEYALLRQYIADHNRYSPSAFIVHIGDIITGACVESKYAEVADIMKGFAVPAYIVVGDNEYNDCGNPAQALSLWKKYFLNFEQNFCGAPFTEHQSVRPENLAFTMSGVLFIGINLVGGEVHDQNEWNTRMQEDADWVSQQFQAKVSQVRAAVVFAQAGPEGSANSRAPFLNQFRGAAATFGKPVLYVQGNTHNYKLAQPWPEKNITQLIVPKGNAEPPLEVTVTMSSNPQSAFVIKRKPWGSTAFNMPPCVNAGVDQTISINTLASLEGAASDDGDPSGVLTTIWHQVSGPGTTTFGDANSLATTASFSAPGTYILSLTANDGQLLKSDEVTITAQGQVLSPTLSIGDVSINEGNSGTVDVLFVVSLANPNSQRVTVGFRVVDGAATKGSDYSVISSTGTMTFNVGVTTQRLRVTIIGDLTDEQDETFFVNLSNATNAIIADNQGVGTIINDDGPPAPNAPSNLTANATGTTAIAIAWNDNSNDEDGFKIERKVNGGSFSEINAAGANSNSYNDTGLSAGATYVYRIRAYKAAANSGYSNEATATTPLPMAPSNLTANATGASTVSVAWVDNSSDEDGFKIERTLNGGSFSEITRVGANINSYSDTGLSPGMTYVYRVRSFKAAANSNYSNEASATTANAGNGNLALNKPITASSTDPEKPVANAVDGNTDTYWRSGAVSSSTPPAWLRVDLGAAMTIGKAVVSWKENYYAKSYEVQVSKDNVNWTPVHSATGSSGVQSFSFIPTSGRYVRLYFTKNNKSNYRVLEFEVYSNSASKRDGEMAAAAAMPEEFVLEQNYPNPFSARGLSDDPGTRIGFSLPQAEHVTIKVYTINGIEVKTLADAPYSAGRHVVEFKPKNLPSGTYLYVMQAGAVRQVRRLMLVK
jgi:hypothetical protein